jgi:hypothetical protein
MFLSHGGFCTVRYVANQLSSIWQGIFAAVHVSRFFFVNQKEMVASFAASDVYILAQFNIAFGAQDRQPSIAPRV